MIKKASTEALSTELIHLLRMLFLLYQEADPWKFILSDTVKNEFFQIEELALVN
jgi:hypothetical protein